MFINDGAPWIKQWIEDAFPDVISILDFWYALEYLYSFEKRYFKDEIKGKKWAEKQKLLLLDGKVKQVIQTIKKLAPDILKKIFMPYRLAATIWDAPFLISFPLFAKNPYYI